MHARLTLIDVHNDAALLNRRSQYCKRAVCNRLLSFLPPLDNIHGASRWDLARWTPDPQIIYIQRFFAITVQIKRTC